MHFSPRRTQRVCRLAVSAPVMQSNKKGAKNRTQLVTRPAVSRRLKLRLETETETEADKIHAFEEFFWVMETTKLNFSGLTLVLIVFYIYGIVCVPRVAPPPPAPGPLTCWSIFHGGKVFSKSGIIF